jgi:hypothetical protein
VSNFLLNQTCEALLGATSSAVLKKILKTNTSSQVRKAAELLFGGFSAFYQPFSSLSKKIKKDDFMTLTN